MEHWNLTKNGNPTEEKQYFVTILTNNGRMSCMMDWNYNCWMWCDGEVVSRSVKIIAWVEVEFPDAYEGEE